MVPVPHLQASGRARLRREEPLLPSAQRPAHVKSRRHRKITVQGALGRLPVALPSGNFGEVVRNFLEGKTRIQRQEIKFKAALACQPSLHCSTSL